MPGSRRGEITAILPLMLDGIQKLILLDTEAVLYHSDGRPKSSIYRTRGY